MYARANDSLLSPKATSLYELAHYLEMDPWLVHNMLLQKTWQGESSSAPCLLPDLESISESASTSGTSFSSSHPQSPTPSSRMGDDKKGDMNYVIPPDALLSLLPKLLSTSREKGLLLLDKLMHSLQESDLSIEHLDGLGYTMAPASSSSSFMRSSSTPMTETLETDEDEDMAMAGGDDMRGGT